MLDDAIMPAVDYRLPVASPRSRSKTLSALSFFIRERSAWKFTIFHAKLDTDGISTFLDMLTLCLFPKQMRKLFSIEGSL